VERARVGSGQEVVGREKERGEGQLEIQRKGKGESRSVGRQVEGPSSVSVALVRFSPTDQISAHVIQLSSSERKSARKHQKGRKGSETEAEASFRLNES